MFPGLGILPIQMPKLPGEVMPLTATDRSRPPRTLIDANFNTLNRRSPGRSVDPVLAVFHGDLGGHGLESVGPTTFCVQISSPVSRGSFRIAT